MTTEVLEEGHGSDQWFIRRGAQVRGPFGSGRIRHFLIEGQLSLEDEVSRDKRNWSLIARVPEVVPRQFRCDDSEDEAAIAAEEKRGRIKATITMVVAVSFFAVALGLTIWLGDGGGDGAADCEAVPAPGVHWQNCRKEGLVAPAADMQDAHLSNARLMMARLAGVDLRRADMRFVDLTQADLAFAKLQGVDLTGASLRGADLSNANLSGADLSFADLTDVRLDGSRLDGARLRGAIWLDGRRCAETSLGVCAAGP